MPALSSKYAKGESKGLVVIGVTDESPELVDPWVADVKPEYPIVILEGGEFEKALNVQFFPTGAVIDPSGNLVFSGSAGDAESPLGKALDQATPGSVVPKKLAGVAKQIRARDLPKAFAELKKLKGLDEESEGWALRLGEYLESEADAALTAARAAAKDGRVLDAVEGATPFAKAPVAFQATPGARDLLSELAAMPTYKKELAGGDAFRKAAETEAERKFADAANAFADVARRFAKTRIGEAAEARAKSLAERGLPGMKDTCGACREAKRACEKHAETIRL